MKTRRFNPFFRVCLAASIAITFAQTSNAATGNWSGATGGTWGTATNWNPNAVPSSTSDLTILGPGNVAGALNINVAAAAAANSLFFFNAAATTQTNTTSGANQTLTL